MNNSGGGGVLVRLALMMLLLVGCQPLSAYGQRSLKELREKLKAPFDTTRDDQYWKRALIRGKLNFNDSSVTLPRGLQAAVKSYKWIDRTFNSYDSNYVVSVKKKWKVMLKNSNVMNSYSGSLLDGQVPFYLHSTIYSTFGMRLSFMGLSVGGTLNLNNLIAGERLKSKKLDFSFACSRLAVEGYYDKDEGEAKVYRLGYFESGPLEAYDFNGLDREVYGIYGYYFFNHTKYAQAAPYSFSKFQRRSAGSPLTGIHVSHQDVKMDLGELSDFMQQTLPTGRRVYRFRYNDYSALLGYGYNWVFHRNWVYNITATTGWGFRYAFADVHSRAKGTLAFNYRIKMALVLNKERFFYGIHFLTDGRWFRNRHSFFYNATHGLNFTTGWRF